MRDLDQYHGPVGCRFYLIQMMSKPPYDVMIGVLCCLYSFLLIALIIQDDYLELEPTLNGFKYAQFGFVGAFMLDNIINYAAYGVSYFENDIYVVVEIIAILVTGLLVFYNEKTQDDFFCRSLKFSLIFRKLYTVKQKETVHSFMEMYEKVN